jgi:SAM-dependent methyltransferase
MFHIWRLATPRLGGRKWYQYIDFGNGVTTQRWSAGQAKLRTSSFLSFLSRYNLLTKEDIVLDIGCNAGLFSLVASQTCRHVYGVEIDSRFIHQARFLKRHWKAAGKHVDNVTFIYGSITGHLDLASQATVIFASKVLYHTLLGDRVNDLMDAIEKGSSRLIVMQGHTVRGTLGQDDGMRDLVTRHGFKYSLVDDVPDFPIAIASRTVRNLQVVNSHIFSTDAP